jgi:hypothetical protein
MADSKGDKETAMKAMLKIKEIQAQQPQGDVAFFEAEAEPIQQQERSMGDIAQGVYETGRNLVEGAAGAPMYIAAATEGIYKRFTEDGFSPEDAAKYANEAASYFITPPESQTGKDIAEFMGDVGGALPPTLGVTPAIIPNVATGIQGARAVKDVADAKLMQQVEKIPQRNPMTDRGKANQQLAQIIQNDPENVEAARYELADRPNPQSSMQALKQKVMPPSPIQESPISVEAIKQGFDEGVVQPIKAANKETKKLMRDMLELKDKARKNRKMEMRSKPFYVVGDEIKKRGLSVLSANKDAGKAIDKAARSLKGKPADAATIGRQFSDNLSNIGVKLTDDGRLDFSGSDIEDNPAAEKAIQYVVNRMKKGGNLDAYDLHRMKRFIDDKVTYGKNAEGLAGVAENTLKKLRRNIDQQLDDNYPEYDAANTAYKETRDALDTLQDVAGKKFDLTGENSEKKLGNLSRRIMSNAQTAGDVITLIDDVTNTANKYINYKVADDGQFLLPDLNAKSKKVFNADIDMLALFSDELDNRFGPSSRTSFENLASRQAQNDIRKAADAMTSQGRANIILEKGGAALEKARGVNDDNAFLSMYDLLKENNQ